ncbi:MAG: mitochondrial fission ELM1 family protein [Alphaproteobacteria bacterium]|nr:mitochondrial fission ELM1 family protein [Alphaproteobacteria bacterium]
MAIAKREGWILCDQGKTGTYRQCLALANVIESAYSISFTHKEISLKGLWRNLPPQFARFQTKPERLQKDKFSLKPPYPSAIIAAGRQAVTAAMAFRGHSFIIVLQNPHIKSSYFDLVIPPLHDEVKGDNVFSTLGALHPIRPEALLALRQNSKVLEKYQSYSEKRIAVMVGGDNKYYRYTAEFMKSLIARLRYMITEHPVYRDGSLLITPSRRTRPEMVTMLQAGLKGLSCQIWDGKSDNPYLEYLALADALVVTGDSISMMSEACLMGKPVYIAEVSILNTRFQRFKKSLYDHHHAQNFFDELAVDGFVPLDELGRIREVVLEKIRFSL